MASENPGSSASSLLPYCNDGRRLWGTATSTATVGATGAATAATDDELQRPQLVDHYQNFLSLALFVAPLHGSPSPPSLSMSLLIGCACVLKPSLLLSPPFACLTWSPFSIPCICHRRPQALMPGCWEFAVDLGETKEHWRRPCSSTQWGLSLKSILAPHLVTKGPQNTPITPPLYS